MAMRSSSKRIGIVCFFISLFAAQIQEALGGYLDHKYAKGDVVPLYANKIGPFRNPSETYQYFDLPFCPPAQVTKKRESLSEVLNGDRMVHVKYKLTFRDDKELESVCKKTLSREDVKAFREAVEQDYYFQMYYDDVPTWGFIGRFDEDERKYLLFTCLHFEVLYNEDRVIEISTVRDVAHFVDITEDKEVDVDFQYSVKWRETYRTFDHRLEKYAKFSFLPQHVRMHWFSILNLCFIVLLLVGLAGIVIPVLKKDFIKYSSDEETLEDQEKSGWKYIHGDVFRYPPHKSLFCALIGSGTQLFALTVVFFLLGLIGVIYPYNRGALLTALVLTFALTAGISGYSAASLYQQLEGSHWVYNLLLTACMFCGPLFLTFCFLNTIAMAYKSTAALPFGSIVVILLIYTLVAFPLLVLGGIAGKHCKAKFQAPCRTTPIPREIPPLAWHKATIPQMVIAGILPSSAIFIELRYIFSTAWGHKVYTIYSFHLAIFIILIIVTALITTALTYFQLAAEDHEWWWRSILCGGSTSVFVFAYCFYFYFTHSGMTGLLQTSFFFGYMVCACFGLFLMLGTVGFRASFVFVRYIYGSIKCE